MNSIICSVLPHCELEPIMFLAWSPSDAGLYTCTLIGSVSNGDHYYLYATSYFEITAIDCDQSYILPYNFRNAVYVPYTTKEIYFDEWEEIEGICYPLIYTIDSSGLNGVTIDTTLRKITIYDTNPSLVGRTYKITITGKYEHGSL